VQPNEMKELTQLRASEGRRYGSDDYLSAGCILKHSL
jgi:hypothetical protein